MAISRWDPFTALARLDTEFDDLVRRAWGATPGAAGAMAARGEGFVPAIDMTTEGGDVVISVELPGVDVAKDVDLEVSDGRLVISGHREDRSERTERVGAQGRLLVREMRSGSFRREFALPEGVGADDVEATYDQGILEVRVRHVAKPVPEPRKVPIRGAEPGRPPEGKQPEGRTIEGSITPD